jgi:hypothetical protein
MTSGLMRMLRSRAVKPFIEHVVVPAGDLLLAPLVLLAALLMKLVRRVGVYRMTVSRAILRAVGVFPIRDHYYEPMFDPRQLARPVSAPSSGARALPGLDLNEAGQLALASIGRRNCARCRASRRAPFPIITTTRISGRAMPRCSTASFGSAGPRPCSRSAAACPR